MRNSNSRIQAIQGSQIGIVWVKSDQAPTKLSQESFKSQSHATWVSLIANQDYLVTKMLLIPTSKTMIKRN